MTSPGSGDRFDRFSYPRLNPYAPILRRGPTELQVGLDQEPALIFTDADWTVEQLLGLLDGCHHLRQIRGRSQALGHDQRLLDWLLHTLDQAGLLTEGGRRLTSKYSGLGTDKHVRLVGAGTFGREIGQLLSRSGLGALYLVDETAVDPTLYPTAGALGTQSEALRALVGDTGTCRVSVVNHWSKPESVRPDLTIIASDTLECDRVVTDGLMRADEPHLLVRPRAGGVVVGPLVIPGQTACVRCMDLTRRDADSAWIRLLCQLVRIRMSPAAALAGWAGAIALAQVFEFLQAGATAAAGATIEICPPDFVTRWRGWPMHPGCGCGWGFAAQWEA